MTELKFRFSRRSRRHASVTFCQVGVSHHIRLIHVTASPTSCSHIRADSSQSYSTSTSHFLLHLNSFDNSLGHHFQITSESATPLMIHDVFANFAPRYTVYFNSLGLWVVENEVEYCTMRITSPSSPQPYPWTSSKNT